MEDFSRQLDLITREELNKNPIHIIGVGATGSWLTLMLAKLGAENITVYDFDKVEEHNLPNQFYKENDALNKKSKVVALRDSIFEQTGTIINLYNKKVGIDDSVSLEGFVFILTDSMASRKEIFEVFTKNNPQIKLVIETRMGLTHGRIYAIDPNNKEHIEKYLGTFYGDDEAEVSACGTSQSVAVTGIGIAQEAVFKLIKYIKKQEDTTCCVLYNEVLIDYMNNLRFGVNF